LLRSRCLKPKEELIIENNHVGEPSLKKNHGKNNHKENSHGKDNYEKTDHEKNNHWENQSWQKQSRFTNKEFLCPRTAAKRFMERSAFYRLTLKFS